MENAVLIVDDDLNLLDAMKRRLRKESYTLHTADSAEAALRLLNETPIDIIVSDQQMPGMDGTTFLAKVRKMLPDTVRIMLTGNATMDVAIEAINNGSISRFLTKPCDMQELRATISEALFQIKKRQDVERIREDLERMAMYDELTGVLNRRGMMDRLSQEMLRSRRYGSPLGLLMIDLDHFKQVNDTYGHLAGDKVLSIAAGVIEGNSRPSDILGRYGGEEFCLILNETHTHEAMELAERLRRCLEKTRHTIDNKNSITVTCSIGVASFTDDIPNEQAFIDAADRALYQAKENGRNQIRLSELQHEPQ